MNVYYFMHARSLALNEYTTELNGVFYLFGVISAWRSSLIGWAYDSWMLYITKPTFIPFYIYAVKPFLGWLYMTCHLLEKIE